MNKMTIKKKYRWDAKRFFETVEANQLDDAAIANIIDVHVRTIQNKREGKTDLSMSEFVRIVNVVGLDPHKFILPMDANQLEGQ